MMSVLPRLARTAVALALGAVLAAGDPAAARIASAAESPSARSGSSGARDTKMWQGIPFLASDAVVNGVKIHYLIAGAGEPVVLLHGYPESGYIWRDVAPKLAKDFRVVVPDLRGMGESEITLGGYTLSSLAEDIHQLVQHVGLGRVMVAGHDWGGAVAYVYAARYPQEVSRLAFLESAVAGAGFEDLWDFRKPNPAFTFIPLLLAPGLAEELIGGREQLFLHYLWSLFTCDKQAAPFEKWKPYVSAARRRGAISAGAEYYRSAYASAEEVRRLNVKPLTIEVLAISGEKSIGGAQEALVRRWATNVTSLVFAGAGHFLPEERPAEVTDALGRFFAHSDRQ
jgi:pimeloyl-ACP methyl ester carboxylesterase